MTQSEICMSKAVLMRDGTPLITILRVTLRRRNVTRIVAWINREDFVVTNMDVRTKEVEEHIPRTQKPSLVKTRPDPS